MGFSIGNGLAAAGYAAGDHFGKSALMEAQSELELMRQQRLEEFKENLRNAPLNRLTSRAKSLMDADLPVEAKPVTSLQGGIGVTPFGDDSYAADTSGFKGDPKAIRATIENSSTMTPQEKTEALAQLDGQFKGETSAAQAAVAGKTRKRSSSEALYSAVDEARASDLPAYAAYEREIGRPSRDERKIDIQQQREDNRATAAMSAEQRRADTEQRRMTIDLAKLDLQQGSLDAQNRRIDALIEHWNNTDEAKANGKAATPERMGSIVNAMNATIKNLDDNKPSAGDKDRRADWQMQRDNAVSVRARAMAKLDANFDDAGVTTPPRPGGPAPAPKAGASRPPLSTFEKR